jgi:hypothetical protein
MTIIICPYSLSKFVGGTAISDGVRRVQREFGAAARGPLPDA